MLLEEIASIWIPRAYSLLHFANFNILPKSQFHATSKNHDSHRFPTLVLFTIWVVLHICYKKSLNSFLRRMQFPFVRRNRIIDGLWVCGFSACSMIFLTYFVPESSDRSCPWRKTSNLRLGVLIHKTFYLHQATLEILVNHCWLKGWTIGLFALDVFTPLQEKSPAGLNALLFFQASDKALLNTCRILLSLSRQKLAKRVAKLIFLLHFINWIYIHILLVPGSLILLYADRNHNWKIQASLWTWIVCEIFNSVHYKEFGCMYSSQCLESSAFPPASREAVEFANILKNHRNSITNNKANGTSAQKQKTELWQTLFCAMTIKKKLKKRNRAKRVAEEEERVDVN